MVSLKNIIMENQQLLGMGAPGIYNDDKYTFSFVYVAYAKLILLAGYLFYVAQRLQVQIFNFYNSKAICQTCFNVAKAAVNTLSLIHI